MTEFSAETVGLGVSGAVAVGLAFRTWITRQGLIQAGDNSQQNLLMNLSAEAKKWKEEHAAAIKIHNDFVQQHHDTLMLIGELRVQNKMLRMLLIQRGMTAEELDSALEIDNGT